MCLACATGSSWLPGIGDPFLLFASRAGWSFNIQQYVEQQIEGACLDEWAMEGPDSEPGREALEGLANANTRTELFPSHG